MDFHKSKLKRKLLKLSNSSHHRHVWNQILSCILEAGEGTQETSHGMCAWERLNVFVYLDLNKKKLKLGIGWRIRFKDHQTQPGNILPMNIKIPGSKSASQTNPHLCQWTSPGVKWYSFIQHSDLLTWTQHRAKASCQLPSPSLALFRSGTKSRKFEVLGGIFTIFPYLLPEVYHCTAVSTRTAIADWSEGRSV